MRVQTFQLRRQANCLALPITLSSSCSSTNDSQAIGWRWEMDARARVRFDWFNSYTVLSTIDSFAPMDLGRNHHNFYSKLDLQAFNKNWNNGICTYLASPETVWYSKFIQCPNLYQQGPHQHQSWPPFTVVFKDSSNGKVDNTSGKGVQIF